jgi:hypothetical protein
VRATGQSQGEVIGILKKVVLFNKKTGLWQDGFAGKTMNSDSSY